MSSNISNNSTFFQKLIPESENIKSCFVAVRQASLRSSCCRRIDTPLEFIEASAAVLLHGGATLALAPLHLTKSWVHFEFCKGISIFFDDLAQVSKCILLSALCIYVAAASIFSPKKCVDFIFHPSFFADPPLIQLQSELGEIQLENLRLQASAMSLRERIQMAEEAQMRQNSQRQQQLTESFARQILEIETRSSDVEQQRDQALLHNRELLLLNEQMNQTNSELVERNEQALEQIRGLLQRNGELEAVHQHDIDRIRAIVESNNALVQEKDQAVNRLMAALEDANDSIEFNEAQINELRLQNNNLVQTLRQFRDGVDTVQKTFVKRTSSFSPEQITKISSQLDAVKKLVQQNEGNILRAKIRRVNSDVEEVLQFFLRDPSSAKEAIYEFPIDKVDVPIKEFFNFLGDSFVSNVSDEIKADILEKIKPYKK